jgi:hypothetical protein
MIVLPSTTSESVESYDFMWVTDPVEPWNQEYIHLVVQPYGFTNRRSRIDVSHQLKLALLMMVDLVSQSWNQLYPWVFEASQAIIGVNGLGTSLTTA